MDRRNACLEPGHAPRWTPCLSGIADPASTPPLLGPGAPCLEEGTSNQSVVRESNSYLDTPALRGCVVQKVDIRLPGKGTSNSHGARPVHIIITLITWIRIGMLSIKSSFSPPHQLPHTASGFMVQGTGFRVQGSGFRVQGSGFGVQPRTSRLR